MSATIRIDPETTASGATPLFLSGEEREMLLARIAELTDLAAARLEEWNRGDADELTVVTYHRALEEAARLPSALTDARPIDDIAEDPHRVVLGDTVTVGFEDGTVESYVVAHPVEARCSDLWISSGSPLARAVLGRRVGERVRVDAPAGVHRCTIVNAQRR